MFQVLQDLHFPTRNRTWALTMKVLNPNHWTAREFLRADFLLFQDIYRFCLQTIMSFLHKSIMP